MAMEELDAKQEVASLKVEDVGSKRKSSHIPVLSDCSSLSYVKPRKYKCTVKQHRQHKGSLKRDKSSGNCSKGSISPSPGPPNDDSGIVMDNSVEVEEEVSVSTTASSDLAEMGKAEQESLRALQRAVAEMEADLNVIDSDGDTIIDSDGDTVSDSDGDTVTAENVNHFGDPEKMVQSAVIEKVHQLLPESMLPLQDLLVAPVGQMVQEHLKDLQEDEMVEEVLQNLKGLNSENEIELVEDCLQNLIHAAVQEEQPTKAPKQLQVEGVPVSETKEQRFVREHFKKIELLLHSTPPMITLKEEEPIEQKLHQIEEENDVEVPISISVSVEAMQKEALQVTEQPAEAEIVEFHVELPVLTLQTMEAGAQEEEQPGVSLNSLASAEAIMDLQEELLDNTNEDDEETIPSIDLDGQQDQIPDLISSYVNNGMTLQADPCLQLQDERPQSTINEVDEYGQLQSNPNSVEEILELEQEDRDDILPSTSKPIVALEQKQQPSTLWLLKEFMRTLANEKNAEQIKKLVEEIIKLQNEQAEEREPEQQDEQELSQKVESVSSPLRSLSHSPLLGMAGLRALEGYLDDGILRHLIHQDVAPVEVVPFEQEENDVLPDSSEEALVDQEGNLVAGETAQEQPCGKKAGRFRALLNQLRVYKMPMEFIPLALFGTAFCLLLFFRKF